jgi:hypothetical protein
MARDFEEIDSGHIWKLSGLRAEVSRSTIQPY